VLVYFERYDTRAEAKRAIFEYIAVIQLHQAALVAWLSRA